MWKGCEILESDEGIVLRLITLSDAPAFFTLIERNREHLSQFGDSTSAKYPTLESFERSITNPKSGRVRFGIWVGETLVGTVNISPADEANTAVLGYWVGAQFQGSGYVRKASQLLVRAVFEQSDISKIQAVVTKGNERSVRVLTSIGFELVDEDSFSLTYACNISRREKDCK